MSQQTSVLDAPGAVLEPPKREQATGLDRLVADVPLPSALIGLLGVYLLGAASSFFTAEGSDVPLWWPATGLSVALLLLTSLRRQWLLALGVALASGLASYTEGHTEQWALGFGLSSGLEAYLVAWLVLRGRSERPSLRTMEALWRFLSAAVAGSVAAAVVVAVTAVSVGAPPTSTAAPLVASHLAAILLVTPLVMRLGPFIAEERFLEAVLEWTLLLGSVTYIFSPGQALGLSFLPLPLLLWASLRFGVRTVSYQLLTIGVITTVLTAAGGGPFAAGAADGGTSAVVTASLVHAFLIVTALIALPLAVAVDQRRHALTRVSANEELFHKSFTESFVGMLLLSLSRKGLRIRELNETAAEILGGTVEDLLDQPLEPYLDTRTSWKEVTRRIGSGDLTGWREELWLARDPGRRVAFAMSPMSTAGEEAMFSAQLMDVTEVHEATSRLTTEKDFTEAVLSTTAALIVVVDVDGNIAGINPATERASGRTEAEVLEQPLWGTLAPNTDKRFLRELMERTRPGRETGRTPSVEGDLLTADGRLRRIVWSSAPLTNETGRRTHVVLTGIDVTDERNVRSMTNHLLDAATSTSFVGLDLMGTITIFNAGAQELLGYTADEVTGRMRLEDLHDPDELALVSVEHRTLPGFPTIIAGVESGPRTRDWTYVRKDGSRVACAVTMSEVHDAFGSVIGYLAVGRDVTEYQRSQKILVESLEKEREAVSQLREADRVRDEFVSMVSQELRTPITSMVGYVEMLRDGTAGPVSFEQARLLDTVRTNGDRLLALIDDLLTLSRIEQGSFTLQKTTVDLRMVVNRCQEAVHSMLVGRGLPVRFDAPDHPVLVIGDFPQLERVVVNLLSNAVKFTEDNGHVQCSLQVVDDRLAEVVVSDTGVGIPDDEKPMLFTRFFRGRLAQEFAVQGTGLGLSLVQSIVHSHDGEVSIRSSEDVGTEVRVVLPLVPARHRMDAALR